MSLGAKVRVRSGGPLMRVVSDPYEQDGHIMVDCSWADESYPFPVAVLVLVEKACLS